LIGFYRSIMRLLVVVLTAVILFSVLIGCKGNGPGKDYFPPVYEPDHTEPSESGCNFIPSNPDGSSLLWGISTATAKWTPWTAPAFWTPGKAASPIRVGIR